MTKLLLYHFPRDIWRPSALQVSTLTSKQPSILRPHGEVLHLLPFNFNANWTKNDSEQFPEHGKFSQSATTPLPGKLVRTTRLSETSAIGPENIFGGILICYSPIKVLEEG